MEATLSRFGQEHFGQAQLGDIRRTRRLVQVAGQMVGHPGGTLPEKMSEPADLKAFYRLVDCDAVTHAAVIQTHRQLTLTRMKECKGVVLLIHDTTQLDYTGKHSLENLGQIAKGFHRGYLCHNTLALEADSGQVIGLASQILHIRPKIPKKEPRKKPLEWVLLTNVPAQSFAQVKQRVEWYARRPTVEEFHKAQKTGCGIELPQFTDESRLEPVIALLSVVAVFLLTLRDAARDEQTNKKPATEMVPRACVAVVNAVRWKDKNRATTIGEFLLAVARFGGHQNRKSDGHPGWLTIWRGWQKLSAMMRAVVAVEKCG